MRTSVQMVMLRAPDLSAAGLFYREDLGFRVVEREEDEWILDGYGFQVVLSEGTGDGLTSPPDRERAALELAVDMTRMEDVWERDRRRRPDTPGPMLNGDGVFVYVTLDPAGNAISLVAALPRVEPEGSGHRVTKRLKRLD